MATIPADTRLASRGATTSRVRAVVKALREAPLAAVVILGGLILVAVLADLIAPYDPTLPVKGAEMFAPPFWMDGGSLAMPLGADSQGRTILTRRFTAPRASLVLDLRGTFVAGVTGPR